MDNKASNVKSSPLLELRKINKSVQRTDGSDFLILKDIDLTINTREVVGLIGKSGSGKSTLLRIIAGLIPCSSGSLTYLGKSIEGPRDWLAMVFQSFALFPWLTIFENVAIGLEAQGVPEEEIRTRSLAALDLIGLDGYESAYPRELSGGMKQRVGFARALVVKPQVLLLDEPFSALDILTAAALRAEFMDLWMAEKSWLQSALLVTHNIEEAVLLCDRVLVLTSNPGTIVTEIEVQIPHPRSRHDNAVKDLIEQIYLIMTNSLLDKNAQAMQSKPMTITSELPPISHNILNGLVETLIAEPYHGKADLPRLGSHMHLTVDNLFPILELMQILKFAVVADADIKLTPSGKTYAEADVDGRKKIFAEHLIEYIPLASHILLKLRESYRKKLKREQLVKELSKNLTPEQAEKLIKTITGYGRYAEVFSYDDSSKIFYLE
jgi:NitT/TauT family transport system ATP-binding protein